MLEVNLFTMTIALIIWRIKQAVRFYWQAKTIYQLHSPFVFALVERLFSKQPAKPSSEVKRWWKDLEQDRTILNMEVGSGSSTIAGHTISKAAKTSSSSFDKALFVARTASYLESKCILELGTNLGKTTGTLAQENTSSHIITVEANAMLLRQAKKYFEHLKLSNISSYEAYFDSFIERTLPTLEDVDFVFLDGDHSYEATMKIFRNLIKQSNIRCILLDDIRWNPSMLTAWEEITATCEAPIILDFYNIGMIIYIDDIVHPINYKIIKARFKPWVWW